MNSFEWTNATTVEEALGALGDGAAVKAGGVDILDRMKEHLDTPSRLVNIRNVRALRGVREEAGALRIGPLATLAELASDPAVRRTAPALADAAANAATPQIRNMATVGGNLLQRPRCWYFRSEHFHCLRKGGDHCFAIEGENQYHAIFGNTICAIVHPSAAAIALAALGATVEITSKAGKREIPLETLFVTPETDVTREHVLAAGELLTEIRIPKPAGPSAYLKLGEKESFDWPIAEAAVALEMAGGVVRKASVILGAAAPVPYRARQAEAALVGKKIDDESARAAASAALDGATPLSENAYKLRVTETVVRRVILSAGAHA